MPQNKTSNACVVRVYYIKNFEQYPIDITCEQAKKLLVEEGEIITYNLAMAISGQK